MNKIYACLLVTKKKLKIFTAVIFDFFFIKCIIIDIIYSIQYQIPYTKIMAILSTWSSHDSSSR